MTRVGLLGGSFNPAHRGHRKLSLAAIAALGLDELWWLVSPGNPLKDGEAMAPFEARFASALKIAGGTAIRVSDFERRAGTRFTVDTVGALLAAHPDTRFIWLMGMDTLPNFHRWKAWRELAGLVPIAVLPRPGYDAAARAARAMGWLEGFVRPSGEAKAWTQWSPPAIVFLRLPTDPTSATRLRALDPDWHRRSSASADTARTDGQTPDRRRPLARSPE
jgi:nicotinate-nucleotide adenylyltransferase